MDCRESHPPPQQQMMKENTVPSGDEASEKGRPAVVEAARDGNAAGPRPSGTHPRICQRGGFVFDPARPVVFGPHIPRSSNWFATIQFSTTARRRRWHSPGVGHPKQSHRRPRLAGDERSMATASADLLQRVRGRGGPRMRAALSRRSARRRCGHSRCRRAFHAGTAPPNPSIVP